MSIEEQFHISITSGRTNFFMKVYWYTYAARFYADGDVFTCQMRWYHPLSIIVLAVLLLAAIPVTIFTSLSIQECLREIKNGFVIRPYFKNHPERLKFVTHSNYRKYLNGRKRA